MSLVHDKPRGPEKAFALGNIVAQISRWLGILAVAAMLISVNLEVIGRSFFGHATIWVTEVSTYLVVVITFIGAAFVASKNGNIRIDILLNRFSVNNQKLIESALTWISLFIGLIVLWKYTAFWDESFQSGTRSWSLLNTLLWIPQSSIILGLFGLIIILIKRANTTRNLLAYIPAFIAVFIALLPLTNLSIISLSLYQTIWVLLALVLAAAAIASGFKSIIIISLVFIPTAFLFLLTINFGLAVKSIALITILFFLLFTGLPVVFSLFSIGILSMIFWLPPVTLNYIGERAWESINTFELAAIPMFVLMGAILVRSNASGEMFAATQMAMGRLRGSLAYASIIASGIFAAVSGSSLATAATMGRVAGPAMIQSGYKPGLAYGVLAAGGTLGILIPPSIAMIIYGPLAGVPVTELFIAGIIPGLLMMLAFALVVFIWSIINPIAAPAGQASTFREKLHAMKGVIPFLVLMILVLGSLYAGIATPTEAGAVGVLGALLISFTRKTLSLKGLILSLEETVMTTSFLLLIAVGASVMGFAIDFMSMPQALVKLIDSLALSEISLFISIVILYLILGMFVEPISMVLMTLPIVLPVIFAAGWDPLWFGIILIMLVEIGLITPPVGMILYVLSGVAEKQITIGQISVGILPFIVTFLAMIFIFFNYPQLITVLPELMR